MKLVKNQVMWAVIGRNYGLYGLFHSKHKAEEAKKLLWNGVSIEKVSMNIIDETTVEVRNFKVEINHN